MRKLMVNYIIILSSLLWLNSLAHSGMIEDKVNEAIAAINTSDKGRQALLEEMTKYPNQLERDISRHQTIKIENVEIVSKKTKDLSPHLKADTIYIDILTSLKKNCPKDIPCNNNIGSFFPAEIMYSFVQNFLTHPMKLHNNFYENSKFALNDQWIPINSSQKVAIDFSKKYTYFGDDLLIVTYSENKPYVAMKKFTKNEKSLPSRWVKNSSKTIFNLTTGEVNFTFSYHDSYLPRLKRSYEITTTTLDTDKIIEEINQVK